ncbi:sulfite oxidase-like oxidoreductase [Chloroflexota bacterium]
MAKEPIISPDTQRANRVPPGQHVTDKFPVLQHGNIQRVNRDAWSFTVSGLVELERKLTFSEFSALPQQQVISDIHCVTSWSKLDNTWEGVSAETIKTLASILPEAKFVVVEAHGNFATNLPIKEFFQPDVLFAIKHNGAELSPEHGYPVRLVVPRLYFWKSAKWVSGVRFTAGDEKGFWESMGYHNHGDPWQEERYS